MAKTHAEYLAAMRDPAKRAALEKLRKTIKAALPRAEECISYALPAFKQDGMVVVGFGASTNHCAFYPMSGTTVATLAADLVGFETTKGTIRFTPETPLPTALVKKVIATRLAENAARAAKG